MIIIGNFKRKCPKIFLKKIIKSYFPMICGIIIVNSLELVEGCLIMKYFPMPCLPLIVPTEKFET